VRAEEVQLKPDHPERYTVQKGDTLWDIASRFLRSPWHWPKIWRINEQVRNPHLIYPGDVIVLRWVDGKPVLTMLPTEKPPVAAEPGPVVGEAPPPVTAEETTAAPPVAGMKTVKLQPRAHSEPIDSAIPTIPPSAIAPFLAQPLAVGEKELERAGYITVGLDDRIALGDQSEFYARGVKGGEEFFHVFRPGKAIRHPDTGELLAYEAIHLGEARLLEPGDPAKLVVTNAVQEILPADRLLVAARKPGLPYYQPRAPRSDVKGHVVTAMNAVAEVGPLAVVGVSLGKREGIEEGNVLRVLRHVGSHRDPVTRESYKLPDEQSALLLVFRTFDKMSYALVMTGTRPVHMLDAVTNP
jgi:LysM repeat protein